MSSLTKVKADLDQAKTAVGAAQTLLRQGQAIDLAGLETHVEALCNDIAALPADERVTLKSPLVALIDDLNHLAGEIETRNKMISDALEGGSVRRRAAAAYAGHGKDDS